MVRGIVFGTLSQAAAVAFGTVLTWWQWSREAVQRTGKSANEFGT
jgi:hypothetical protein